MHFSRFKTQENGSSQEPPKKRNLNLKARRARRTPALKMLSRSARSLRKHLTGVRAFASGSVPDVMVRDPPRTTRDRAAADRDFFSSLSNHARIDFVTRTGRWGDGVRPARGENECTWMTSRVRRRRDD
jgi:hypothetical protein